MVLFWDQLKVVTVATINTQNVETLNNVVLTELLVKNVFLCNTDGQDLIYLNNHFQNHQTYIDWNGQLIGPIHDEHGVEQGGVNSSDLYKIFGKVQHSTAQEFKLGVPLGNLTISRIGQADNTAISLSIVPNLLQEIWS